MIACYGAGTMLLQMGFQRGGALVTAGLATLFTNAIPSAPTDPADAIRSTRARTKSTPVAARAAERRQTPRPGEARA
jgi:hypothetical protein